MAIRRTPRTAASQPAVAKLSRNPPRRTADFDPHPRVVLMRGKNNPTFLISWRSQRDLANSLGWKCTLMIWGGSAIALLSLYGLITLAPLF